jgi:hypothetical protein
MPRAPPAPRAQQPVDIRSPALYASAVPHIPPEDSMCDTSKPVRAARARRPGRLARVASGIRARAARAWRFLTGGRGPAIEVLLTESARRRAIERELRIQLRNLSRELGTHLPVDAIVVQQVLLGPGGDQERAGCTRATTRNGGRRRTLMLLALQANGRRFSTDEVLSALAIQAMALIGDAGVTELHSVTFPPSQPPSGVRPEYTVGHGEPPAARKVEGRRAMLELIHGTAPIAPAPHINGQEPAPLPGA